MISIVMCISITTDQQIELFEFVYTFNHGMNDSGVFLDLSKAFVTFDFYIIKKYI